MVGVKRCLSLAIAFVVACAPLPTWAAEPPAVTIKHSRSPDGRRDFAIVENEEFTGVASGTAEIRDVKTGKILGSFPWNGFGVHPGEESFKVLWRPDSRCFAINWEETRGFVTCAVYAWSKGGWLPVKLPDFGARSLKLARAAGPSRVAIDETLGGKGHETAVAWLPGNRLRIDAGYREMWPVDVDGEWAQRFWFTLAIVHSPGQAESRAILKDARLAPRSVYRSPP